MSNAVQLSAKERIYSLLDDNSFVEVGSYIRPRNTDFNLLEKDVPADGVVTGYGLINGKLVYVYSQDPTVLGGSIGEMHAKKIVNIYELALKVGVPVIGIIDCSGLRLQESTDALDAFGKIFLVQSKASGIIPQITAIVGDAGGGLSVMAGISDFTFIDSKQGKLFINSPSAIQGNYKDKLDTSSAMFQAEAGLIDIVSDSQTNLFNQIRDLIDIIPANNENDDDFDECTDDLNRLTSELESNLKDSKNALKDISDNNYFYEIKNNYAKEMVTGFIKLNGMTVGAIANRSEIRDESQKVVEKFDGSLTSNACYKAAKFISFCDAFEIPILSLTNVNGYKATIREEQTIANASAKLTYAFANATVPKVNLIIGQAFGSAYISMNSKHIGADMVFALPTSEIGMMNSDLAAQIMYPDLKDNELKDKAKEYSTLQSSAIAAAKRGYVDDIIEPESVRQHLIYAFEMLFSKREYTMDKKHGTL